MILLFLTLLAGFRDPFMQRYRAWDADRSMSLAAELARNGQWREVSAQIEKIGGRIGNHYSLIQLNIESSVRIGKTISSKLLIAGFLHPEATSADRARYLGIALEGDDFLTFSQLYNHLSEPDRLHPDIVFTKGQLLLQLKRFAEAAALAREQSVKDATDTRFLLLQARAILEHPDTSAEFAEAQRIIARLISSDAPEARAAFGLLSLVPIDTLDPNLFRGGERWLLRQENPKISERLIAEAVKFAALPEHERPQFADSVARILGPKNPSFVADWLISIGMEEKAQLYFDPGRSREHPSNYRRHLDALLAAGNWEAAREWLASPPAQWAPVDVWLMRARLAQASEQKVEWRKCIEHAFFSASIVTSQNYYFAIFDQTLRHSEFELATRAAMQGIRHPSAVIPPAAYFDPLLAHLWQQTRLDEFRELLDVLRRREPADPYLLNAELYLALLRKSSMDRPVTLIGEAPEPEPISATYAQLANVAVALCERHPDEPGFITTAALALFQNGNFKSAQTLLGAIPDRSWGERSAADRAIQAFITEKSGKSTPSGDRREKIVPDHLNRLEQEVLVASVVR